MEYWALKATSQKSFRTTAFEHQPVFINYNQITLTIILFLLMMKMLEADLISFLVSFFSRSYISNYRNVVPTSRSTFKCPSKINNN